MARLEARALTVAVGDRVLCRDLDIAIGEGENWAILGANGSGKTTLLHALAGLRRPEGGEVLLDGAPIAQCPPRERARRLGVLFQDYDAGFPATVLELALTGRHPHLARFAFEGAEDRAAAERALASVGLDALAERSIATLSGGERRRAEIAALLAQDPPICLLDEPTNHLDLRHQGEILRLLADRSNRPSHANVFVLHDVTAAARIASHALLLFADSAHRSGPAAELFDPALLERVYGCPFERMVADGRRFYFAR